MAERQTYIPPEGRGLTEEEDQMREAVGNALNTKKTGWKHFTPEFVGTKANTSDVNSLIAHINESSKRYQEGSIEQSEGFVRINTTLPLSLAHIGDLHLGSNYTDTAEVMRKIKKLKEEPNVYIILMANLIDNAIPAQFPDTMLSNAIPPDKQVFLMRAIIEDLNDADKIVAAVTSPCHEGWTWKKAGQDVNALMFDFPKRKFPVLENGGELHVQVGNIKYTGALYHQVGPFESNFNETHALRQLNRLKKGMRMDWMAGAHRHFAAAESVYEDAGDKRRIVGYVRTGTEKGTGKIHDKWAVGRSGNDAEPTGQTIHLWPDKRRLLTTLDFDDAMLAHEAYYLYEMARHGN